MNTRKTSLVQVLVIAHYFIVEHGTNSVSTFNLSSITSHELVLILRIKTSFTLVQLYLCIGSLYHLFFGIVWF